LSKAEDGYNACHRLEHRKLYRIVLVPSREIEERSMSRVWAYARRFGYEIPQAGIMLRLFKFISIADMNMMNIDHILSFHVPITVQDGDKYWFLIAKRNDRICLESHMCHPTMLWVSDKGVFAFLDPR
jgi:hypothetical protein